MVRRVPNGTVAGEWPDRASDLVWVYLRYRAAACGFHPHSTATICNRVMQHRRDVVTVFSPNPVHSFRIGSIDIRSYVLPIPDPMGTDTRDLRSSRFRCVPHYE